MSMTMTIELDSCLIIRIVLFLGQKIYSQLLMIIVDGRWASTILIESYYALLEEQVRRARSDDGRLSAYN